MLVNTRGVQIEGVKDKVFHALANLGIPLSDRQEKALKYYPHERQQNSDTFFFIFEHIEAGGPIYMYMKRDFYFEVYTYTILIKI